MPPSLATRITLAATAVLTLTSCRELAVESVAPLSPNTLAQRAVQASIADPRRMTDSLLWQSITRSGNLATVGLKDSSSSRRGVERGKPVIDELQRAQGTIALRKMPGGSVTEIDTLLPRLRLRITNFETMRAIRQIPFVDYIEAAYQAVTPASGCDYTAYTAYQTTASNFAGDILSPPMFLAKVDIAWAYTRGEGTTIGLTDTGADEGQYDLGAGFSSGLSTNRAIIRSNLYGATAQQDPPCSHGTRSAGILAAAMNGYGTTGVAWKANLISVIQENGLVPGQSDAVQAIRIAGQLGARMIAMAWATPDFSSAVSDEIQYWYYQRDVVFVAAAGTSCCNLPKNWVLFPASMSEVVAVSTAENNGLRSGDSHFGSELDIIAYNHVATTGSGSWGATPVIMDETSSSTALVGGVAALIRSRYPNLSAPGVVDRLLSTAGLACGMPTAFHKLVNAEAAVGGICLVNNDFHQASEVIFTNESPEILYVPYSVFATGGDGPLEYTWTNHTTGPSTSYGFPNLGYDYVTVVSVTIRDTGNPNHHGSTFDKIIGVYDRRCTPVPPAVECNPTP